MTNWFNVSLFSSKLGLHTEPSLLRTLGSSGVMFRYSKLFQYHPSADGPAGDTDAARSTRVQSGWPSSREEGDDQGLLIDEHHVVLQSHIRHEDCFSLQQIVHSPRSLQRR
jgi:hypothetical protein